MLALGIPIALLVTAVVWHFVGISDDVLLSQSARYNADQVAFESAVWHARGMNLIAVMNLAIMVLTAAETAWTVVVVWSRLAAGFCFLDRDLCVQAQADALSARIQAADPQVLRTINEELESLARLERIVSSATPKIAVRYQSEKTQPSLIAGNLSFGASFISDSQMGGVLGGGARMNTGADQPSLPVEEIPARQFCQELRPWMPELIWGVLGGLHEPWLIPFARRHPDIFRIDRDSDLHIREFACKQPNVMAGIWQEAKVRPDFGLQVYGVAFGRPGLIETGDSNVRRLAGDSPPGKLPDCYSVSQTEYFPDCNGQPWRSCAALPMFSPNWTASLRRIRVAPELQTSGVLSLVAPSVRFGAPPDFASAVLGNPGVFWRRVNELVH